MTDHARFRMKLALALAIGPAVLLLSYFPKQGPDVPVVAVYTPVDQSQRVPGLIICCMLSVLFLGWSKTEKNQPFSGLT